MSSTQEVGDIFGSGKGPAQAMLRSPTVIILCVGLWGMNVFFYKLFGIDYVKVLKHDLIEIDKEEREKRERASAKGGGGGGLGGVVGGRRRKGSDNDVLYSEVATTGDAPNSNGSRNNSSDMNGGSASIEMMPTMDKTDASVRSEGALGGLSGAISPLNKRMAMHQRSRSASPSRSDDFMNIINNSNGTTTTALERSNSTSSSSQNNNEQTPELFSQGPGSTSIDWWKLVSFSVVMLLMLHFTTHYWIDHLHRGSIGAVVFFYSVTMFYIFVPCQQNTWLRRSFVIVVQRTWALIHPRCFCVRLLGSSKRQIAPRRIPFVDVFYADAMCSLSKVFFDWGYMAHQAAHYPNPVPAATHNIVIPSLCAALPYVIRARQCLIMRTVARVARDQSKMREHVANAIKYSTSMYPLILSAYIKTLPAETETGGASIWNVTLIVLLVINASYSLYWDIVMDWGMMQDPYKVARTTCGAGIIVTSASALTLDDGGGGESSTDRTNAGGGGGGGLVRRAGGGDVKHSDEWMNKSHFNDGAVYAKVDPGGSCQHGCLRPSLRFGFALSALIVVADSFLRFSWTLKFVPRLFPTNDSFVLCTQFLEVFRRAIWNLLRVEWESMKQSRNNASNINNSSAMSSMMIRGSGKAPDSLSDNEFDDYEHNLAGEQQRKEFEMKPLGGVASDSNAGGVRSAPSSALMANASPIT